MRKNSDTTYCRKIQYMAVDGIGVLKVDAFKEKTILETACKYLDEGNCLWNAGIFVCDIETITKEIRKNTPGLADKMDRFFYSERRSIL